MSLLPRGSGGVTVVLRRAGVTLVERSLHVAQDDCPALANTIALMAEAWLTAPAAPRPATQTAGNPSGKNPSPAAAPIAADPDPEPRPEASHEPQTPTPGPAKAATSVPDARAAPAGPADVASTPAPALAAKPLAELAVPSAPLPEVRETLTSSAMGWTSAARGWSVTVAAAASGLTAMSTPAAPVMSAGGDLRLDRGGWFVGLRGAVETQADLDGSAAKVLARHTPVNAYLGRALGVGGGHLSLEALVGGGVDVVLAHSSGYASDRSFEAVAPLMLTGLQAEWLVGRHFGIVAAAEILVALRRDQFVVANLGPVAATPRARAGLGLGVAWHLR